MIFDTREQVPIRRAFDAMLNLVGPAPDLGALIEREHLVQAEPDLSRERRPAVVSGVAFAAVVVVMGAIVLFTSAPPSTTTATTGTPGGGAVADGSDQLDVTAMSLSEMPILAILGEWHPTDAFEEDTTDGGIRGIDYAVVLGEPGEDEVTARTAQLRLFGVSAGSVAESAMWWANQDDYEVIGIDSSSEARLFVYEDGYRLVWRPGSSSNVLVTLSVLPGQLEVTTDHVIEMANSLIELHPDAWQELLVVFSEDYASCPAEAVGC